MNAKDGRFFRQRTTTKEYPASRLSTGGGTLRQVTRRCQPDFHRQGKSSPIRLMG